MSSPTGIEEIFRRAEQGVLRPFLCRGDDDVTYFVKGRGAGARDLIAEYICARLGALLGLPIPPFGVVEVSGELIAGSTIPGIGELGEGPAFGSVRVEFVQELSSVTAMKVSQELRARVFLFDWWILNEDRHLTERGGNPNLLWNYEANDLVVFDHNLAFDREFRIDRFRETHAFAGEAAALSDPEFRTREAARFEGAFEELDTIFAELPDEWREDASDFDIDAMSQILKRHRSPEFWHLQHP